MILNNKYFLFYFLLFLVSTSFSQENKVITKDATKIENLDEIIITATRTIRQLSSLPLPAQIIAKKDIKRSNSIRLNDILNEQTGLITIPDFGGGEGIQLQGLDSQYTLILVDGVPLIGRLAGTLDIRRITVGNIKQIEIVKGAS
ncbi:MAG: TonB-dependent receptor plug domain-containing protein, partial [Polaribacter sp.]